VHLQIGRLGLPREELAFVGIDGPGVEEAVIGEQGQPFKDAVVESLALAPPRQLVAVVVVILDDRERIGVFIDEFVDDGTRVGAGPSPRRGEIFPQNHAFRGLRVCGGVRGQHDGDE
jgi:hypothetical protein